MTSQITSTNRSATDGQIKQFSRLVEDAALSAIDTIGINKSSMQNIIEHGGELQQGLSQVIQKLAIISPEPNDRYGYLEGRSPRLEDLIRQMDIIHAQPEYAHLDLNAPWKLAKELLKSPDIPMSRQKLQVSIDPLSCFPDYNQALEASINILSRSYGKYFESHVKKRDFGPECLRQVATLVNPIESKLREQQGSGIWVELFRRPETEFRLHLKKMTAEFLKQEQEKYFLAQGISRDKRRLLYGDCNYALPRSTFMIASWLLVETLEPFHEPFAITCDGDIASSMDEDFSCVPCFYLDFSVKEGCFILKYFHELQVFDPS